MSYVIDFSKEDELVNTTVDFAGFFRVIVVALYSASTNVAWVLVCHYAEHTTFILKGVTLFWFMP